MNASAIRFLILVILCFGAGCASIMPPTGGKKDVTPPKLVSVTPADSLLNTRVSKIEMYFDEYITVSDVSKEVAISPILAIQPTVTGQNKHVTVHIPDTLLEPNTTYRLSFGKAIKDLHEGNPFTGYTYTFSTGSYFDSLEVHGSAIVAATGQPDSSGLYVMLYDAADNDSAVVRKKPKYITKADVSGSFSLKGLPAKKFRIYALKDANNNMIYDGGKEMIGFTAHTITPGDTAMPPIQLRVFAEIDTSRKGADTTQNNLFKNRSGKKPDISKEFTYNVAIDTSDIRKRTLDITHPVDITFTRPVAAISQERMSLMVDSSGIEVETAASLTQDTNKNLLHLNAVWQENTVYTLRLLKGFAKDTAGTDAMPSRFTFRTKRDEDYAKLQIHLPTKYYGKQFVLVVQRNKDTIYQKPVADTMVNLTRLQPGTYNLHVIIDSNENGKWDTGNLFEKIQPEVVIPYNQAITLKAGWDNIIDFEPQQKSKPAMKNRPGAR